MIFCNLYNKPKTKLETSDSKTRVTSVGFVTLGARIRGLLVNNQLDVSGIKQVDDYDDNPKDEDWKSEKDVPYDESQDFMDKIDLVDKTEEVSQRIKDSVEAELQDKKTKSKIKENPVEDSSTVPSQSETDEGRN